MSQTTSTLFRSFHFFPLPKVYGDIMSRNHHVVPRERVLCPVAKCLNKTNHRTSCPANDTAQQQAHMRKVHPRMRLKTPWVSGEHDSTIERAQVGKRGPKPLIRKELLEEAAADSGTAFGADTTLPQLPELTAGEEAAMMYPDMGV